MSRRGRMSPRGRLVAGVVAAVVVGGLVSAPLTIGTVGASAGQAPGQAPGQAAARRPAVVEHRVIGRTVKGRAIHAWRVGNPNARRTVVALAAIHGDETAPRQILQRLRDGAPVKGIDLWLIPTYNPDGVARGTRKNARGVDLNRNFPRAWRDLDGQVESGSGPASEPETRAMMRFLKRIKPRFVVSFHQPLHGIDTHGRKDRWFARRLADNLHLPRKEFACGNTCHGTFTQWFNHRFAGVTVTVEYGERPSWRRMNIRAPRQLLRTIGGRR